MDKFPIAAAGRVVPGALDNIRRYCGLAWSGGSPECWGWRYYDAVESAHDEAVTPVDVLCASAVHPGLSRSDLAFFEDRRRSLAAFLAKIPPDRRLWEVPEEVVDHVADLTALFPEASVALVSKVLHRKRPHVIPLLDRHIVDWYRPVTGKRAMAEAWGPIVRALRAEETDGETRLLRAIALTPLEKELWPFRQEDERPRLSWIRAVDIAVWMTSR